MRSYLILLIFISLAACDKNKPIEPVLPDKYENGILVLNEGLFEQNNASISFYDGNEAYHQIFKAENGRGLGDIANDFEMYTIAGISFVIVAVDISSQLEIFNLTTLKSVAQIPLYDGEHAREPRQLVTQGTRAYVCNFDGTVAVVDLISNQVIAMIEVGANPDGLVIANDRLYVSNSGGLHYPVYDSTISVIDIHSLSLTETFISRLNSTQLIVDQEGDIYQVSNGNYAEIPAALVRINSVTNTVEEIIEQPISSLVLQDEWLYFYHDTEKCIQRYHTLTETFDPEFKIDLSDFETFHGFFINPNSHDFYCVDANGYVNSSTVKAYSKTGIFIEEFQAGLIATDLIFNLE